MKRRVNYTIDGDLLDRLEKYIERRAKKMGSCPSRSSIVGAGLAKQLLELERELGEYRDLAIVE